MHRLMSFRALLLCAVAMAPALAFAAQEMRVNNGGNFFQAPDLQHNEPTPKEPEPKEPEPKEPEPTPVADSCTAELTENEGVIRLSLTDAARAGKALTI